MEFVGHPLLDRVGATRGRDETLRAHGLDPARRTVLLLPGSRAKEIDYLLPHLLEAVRRLDATGGCQFPLALAHTLDRADLEARVRAAGVPMPVIAGDIYNLIAAADLALVTSGTATLECALLECPMVIVYRLSPLTFALGRLLVRGVRTSACRTSWPEREVVPELLQRRRDGRHIAAAARAILDDPARQATMRAGLRDVRRRLGRGGRRRSRRGHRGRDAARGTAVSTYRRLLIYLRPYLWPHGVLAVVCMLAFSASRAACRS